MSLPLRIVTAQCWVGGLLTVLWAMQSLDRGVSSALGALVIALPNGFFAWRVVSGRAADATPETEKEAEMRALHEAQRLIVGSVVKLVLGVALMVAAFVWYRPEPIAFFSTLIVVQAVHWVGPLVMRDVGRASKNA